MKKRAGMVLASIALVGGGIGLLTACDHNQDPKKGTVVLDDYDEWCVGSDLYVTPNYGFAHDITIRANDPQCQ